MGLLWGGGAGLVPCTPLGSMLLLRATLPSLTGLEAVVLGRSAIVGKPMAALLLAADCTVTVAHSRTRDLPALCRRADILVAAIGKPEMVRGDWIKPGATVIDVGINRIAGAEGKPRLVGDVAFCGGPGHRRRHHAGAGRRRPDDHRLPAAQHAGGGLSAARSAGAGTLGFRVRAPACLPCVLRDGRLRDLLRMRRFSFCHPPITSC